MALTCFDPDVNNSDHLRKATVHTYHIMKFGLQGPSSVQYGGSLVEIIEGMSEIHN